MSRPFAALCALFSALTLLPAAAGEFPPFGSTKSVTGELISADFIHRTGQIRTSDGHLVRFTMPPCAIFQYRGAESDLRDVPLGTRMEYLMLPDEDGGLTRLIATKHGQAPDDAQRQKFVAFTQARGLAGRVDGTDGKTLTVTFFSGAPDQFIANWGEAFQPGKEVRVCPANDELRTWNAATVAEKGTVIALDAIPAEGHGNSGRRITIQVGHQLEGFRPGRIVRVFGAGWPVQNQIFQECLVNYGYSHRPAPDFVENWAKHYPGQFPFRTDHGNRELPWFQAEEGREPPRYAEHVVYGELSAVDPENQSGEFKKEDTGETVTFTLLDTGSKKPALYSQYIGGESGNARLADLALGIRHRFHLFQDASGEFTRCSFICDDFSQLGLNFLNYEVVAIDSKLGRLEVNWQRTPVQNYQKEMETPPPYGRSLLRFGPETPVWNDQAPATVADIQPGAQIRVNLTAELPGRPSQCAGIWFNLPEKARKK